MPRKPKTKKQRIVRLDPLNWAVQEWQEGGEMVTRGRYSGQVSASRWKAPGSYFRKLDDAALSMLHDAIGDFEDGSEVTGAEVIRAIRDAEQAVKASLRDMRAELTDDTLIGLLEERGYKVTKA